MQCRCGIANGNTPRTRQAGGRHVPTDDECDAKRGRLEQLDRVLSVELGVEHLAVDCQHLVSVLQLTRPAPRGSPGVRVTREIRQVPRSTSIPRHIF